MLDLRSGAGKDQALGRLRGYRINVQLRPLALKVAVRWAALATRPNLSRCDRNFTLFR
jgi:hypothetical protein